MYDQKPRFYRLKFILNYFLEILKWFSLKIVELIF